MSFRRSCYSFRLVTSFSTSATLPLHPDLNYHWCAAYLFSVSLKDHNNGQHNELTAKQRNGVSQLTECKRYRRMAEYVEKELISHPVYQQSKRVSVYLPMVHEEINTVGVLAHIFASNQKSCFIPQYIGPKMEMLRLYSMEDYKTLPVTKWNIKQPAEGDEREEALSSGGLDLIIMPGLGFTREGHRLGRGKGYYDKYLQRCSNHPSGMPKTIAVAFREQVLETVPVTDDDQRVDCVLYPDMEEG